MSRPMTIPACCPSKISLQCSSFQGLLLTVQEVALAPMNFVLDKARDTTAPLAELSQHTAKDLMEIYKVGGRLNLEDSNVYVKKATALLAAEPNLVEIYAAKENVMFIGDIHGHAKDLAKVVGTGEALDAGSHVIFLGDYVDRGKQSCEVIVYVALLKVLYPDLVHILRGNHETRMACTHYGFKEECCLKGSPVMFNYCMKLFTEMPIAALVHTEDGDIFAVHAGISPHLGNVRDINGINRRVEDPVEGSMLEHLIWSDPILSHANYIKLPGNADVTLEQFKALRSPFNQVRQLGCYNTELDIEEFKAHNKNVKLIIRSHQVVGDEYECRVLFGGFMIIIFTASYYELSDNSGSYLHLPATGLADSVLYSFKCPAVETRPFLPFDAKVEAEFRFPRMVEVIFYGEHLESLSLAARKVSQV